MKVLLVLVDGMRPDALTNLPQVERMKACSAYTLSARTVMPSVTLPCHMSLFHSVDPDLHGITTNTYIPPMRPIRGICEQLKANDKRCAMFYNWEEIRDLARPGSIVYANFCRGREFGYEAANNIISKAAAQYLCENEIDFTFLYLGYVDMAGHDHGWMSAEYMDAINNSWDNIERIMAALPEDYTVIVTADHGGHDRTHGTELPEDMTIPIFIKGKGIEAGELADGASIKDIAPTIAKLVGVAPDATWEGKSIL